MMQVTHTMPPAAQPLEREAAHAISSATAAVSVRGLSVSYGGNTVVDEIGFKIPTCATLSLHAVREVAHDRHA